MTNRSLSTIRTELEFLTDTGVLTPQQLTSFLSQLPKQTQVQAPLNSQSIQRTTASPQPSFQVPVEHLNNIGLDEKQPHHVSPNPIPSPAPPPAYRAMASGPPPLATASALYAYNATDAGDLALLPNDRIMVLEYVNAEWWKGRSERTGQEGIFPRNYVKVVDEKFGSFSSGLPPVGYGNVPLHVSQGEAGPVNPTDATVPNKVNENGKKMTKKLGNAAIFGAGATVGSKIVNGIF
ncbi:MAG: hypothetical protein M1833_001598 [Piccolia ochrophora]|nr:MAG: hypothetical protein M1833_001598 [Piccolia ochrophora]